MATLEQEDAKRIFQPLDARTDAGLSCTEHIGGVMEIQYLSDNNGMA